VIGSSQPDQQFRSFAISFSPTLLRAAYVVLGDFDLAEDAVQSTMLRTFRRWDHARDAPEAYSRRALISVCRDHWRRQRRRVKEIRMDASRAGARTVSFTEDVERRQALDQALSELPVLQREVLVVRFFFDLSVESTAELLDVPEGTVKSNTHRGLERLRYLLSVPEETLGS
jgi:RNA polymerase sigma-70 factor (sigma-E family)